jgi:hypothetical protein
MATIRKVVQNKYSKKWAYIEVSDENENHFIILGDNEFDFYEQASEFAKNFENQADIKFSELQRFNAIEDCLKQIESQVIEIKTYLKFLKK